MSSSDPKVAHKFELFALTFLLATPSDLNSDAFTLGMIAQPPNLKTRLEQCGFSPEVIDFAIKEVLPNIQGPFVTDLIAVASHFNKRFGLYAGTPPHPVLHDAKKMVKALAELDHTAKHQAA